MTRFPIVAVDESAAEDLSLPAFIVARDGLYLRKRSLLGLSQVKVRGAHHLAEARESLDYGLPKLPAALMGQVFGFFAAVWREKKTEALVLLNWDGEAFGLIVPEQQVGRTSVRHQLDPAEVPVGVQLVGTIHSHGAVDAFASQIDEDDEVDADGIHIVVGELGQARPSISVDVVVDGRRFDVEPSMVLRRPRRWIDPPAEWLERVKLLPQRPKPKAKPRSAASKRRPQSSPEFDDPFDESFWYVPDRQVLTALLDEATEVAADLGFSLTHQLTPVARSAQKGAGS